MSSKIVKDLQTYATLLQTSAYDIYKAQKITDPLTKYCLYSVRKSTIKPTHQNLLFGFISDVKKDIYNIYPPLMDLIQSESTYYLSFQLFNLMTDVTLSKGYKDNYLYNITKRKQYIDDLKRIGEYCDRQINPVNLVMDDHHIYCLPLYNSPKGNYKQDNRNLMLRMIFALVNGERLPEDRSVMGESAKKFIKLLEENYSNPHLDSIIHENLQRDEEEIEFENFGVNNNLKSLAKSLDFRRSHQNVEGTGGGGYDMNFEDLGKVSLLDDDRVHRPKVPPGRVSTIIDDSRYPSVDSYKPFNGGGEERYPDINNLLDENRHNSVYPSFDKKKEVGKPNTNNGGYPSINTDSSGQSKQQGYVSRYQYNLYPNDFVGDERQQQSKGGASHYTSPQYERQQQQQQRNINNQSYSQYPNQYQQQQSNQYLQKQTQSIYPQQNQTHQKPQPQLPNKIPQPQTNQNSYCSNYPQFPQTNLDLKKYNYQSIQSSQPLPKVEYSEKQNPTKSVNNPTTQQYHPHNYQPQQQQQPNIQYSQQYPQNPQQPPISSNKPNPTTSINIPQILTNPTNNHPTHQPPTNPFSSKPPIQNRLTQNPKKDEINHILTSITGFMSTAKSKQPTVVKPQKKPSSFEPRDTNPNQIFQNILEGYLSQFKLYSRLIKSFLTYYITTNLGRVAAYLLARSCVHRKLRLINALIKGEDVFHLGAKVMKQVDVSKHVEKIERTVYKQDPEQFKLLINFKSITPETYAILKPFLNEIDEEDKTEEMCFFYLYTLSQRDPQKDFHHMMLYDAVYVMSSKGFEDVYDYKELPREWDEEYAKQRKQIIELLAFRM